MFYSVRVGAAGKDQSGACPQHRQEPSRAPRAHLGGGGGGPARPAKKGGPGSALAAGPAQPEATTVRKQESKGLQQRSQGTEKRGLNMMEMHFNPGKGCSPTLGQWVATH